MRVLSLIIPLFMLACGSEYHDHRTRHPHPSPDGWKVIDSAIISVSHNPDALYATGQTTITYVSAVANQFTIDTGSVVTNESTDGETLTLGTINASQLRVNNLMQCGPGNNQKCTSAIIRVYTNPLVGYESISGFVNKTNSYGVPLYAGEGTPSQLVGLTVSNAATVDSYTIPANDNKLTVSDFSGVTYNLEVDFSNAGSGSYEMQVVIELAVGN